MKLHIGGRQVKDDWKILNIKPDVGVDFVGDISDLSQFATESIDEIYASHVVEHIPHSKVLPTLEGIHRVLKTGGKLYISVPDMDILSHMFINPQTPLQEKFHVMKMMFGGQTDEFDFHYFGWNEAFLKFFLEQAKFSAAGRVDSFGLFDDTSNFKPYGYPISLNMLVIK